MTVKFLKVTPKIKQISIKIITIVPMGEKLNQDKGVIVGLILQGTSPDLAQEYLDELEFLAGTAGIEVEKRFTQRLVKPDIKFYIGKGKMAELKEFIGSQKIGNVIFDDDLSPSQLRNLEKELQCKIYDRSLLILDIFLLRAKSSQARTQVELAMNQYLLPRLTRMWTHLERQRGGTGTRGGAGEKEIETDRRIIRDQIKVLKTKLEKIEKQKLVQRKSRQGVLRVSLVGYTNVGKSTLMNVITNASVTAEDKLFATVDSTVRKVFLNGITYLLSDTVGFIRKLPHHLVETFKSTLDEIKEADVLIHVVDLSNPSYEKHIQVVEDTLIEIGAVEKPVFMVYNKIDAVDPEEEDFNFSETDISVGISASKKINIDEFRLKLYKLLRKEHLKIYPNYTLPEVFIADGKKD